MVKVGLGITRLTGARRSTGHILTAAVAAGRRSSTNVSRGWEFDVGQSHVNPQVFGA